MSGGGKDVRRPDRLGDMLGWEGGWMFEANFLKMENCNPGPTYSRAPQHTASAYSHLSWEKKKKKNHKRNNTELCFSKNSYYLQYK